MSKYVITIDVGNTNTSALVIDSTNKEIKIRKNYKTDELKKSTLCKDFLDFNDKFVPLGALISSVVPKATKVIASSLEEDDIKYCIIDPCKYENLLKLDVIGKAELGCDIFCGCIASASICKSSITIDMGTAITLALVSDNTLLACAIYPGIEVSFNALFNDTALLSKVSVDEPKHLINGDTTDAIQTGMVYGTLGALKEMINEYKKVVSDARIIFTGGASRLFVKYFEGCIYERDLIHLGLVDIYLRRNGNIVWN